MPGSLLTNNRRPSLSSSSCAPTLALPLPLPLLPRRPPSLSLPLALTLTPALTNEQVTVFVRPEDDTASAMRQEQDAL